MEKILLMIGSILGGFSVAMGAFGAHVMKGKYSEYALEVFEKAVRYEMYHALAIVFAAMLMMRFPESATRLSIAGWFFVAGILFFSGSLYVIAFSGIRAFGAVAPIGGTSFIIGWIVLAYAALSLRV